MKKVIHFVRKSTQLKSSFIQNQILNHIDYEPYVISKLGWTKESHDFAEFNNSDFEILDLSVHSGMTEAINYKLLKSTSPKDVEVIESFLQKVKPDILHFHYGTDAGLFTPIIKKSNIPTVVSFYGYECSGFPRRFMGYGKTFLRDRVFKHITKVFAMSPDMKNDLISIGCPQDKIIVHYYGTDVDKFYLNRKYKHDNITEFLIISGLEPQKGHKFLLEAFQKAYKVNSNINLKIVGTGKLESELKEYIEINNMFFAQMIGKVTYGSVEHMKQLQEADVFIHPSVTDINGDKEGIPGAIIEAMAAGLPVVSTNHAGIPYIIKHGETGLLVNEFDVSSLVEIILTIAAEPELREYLGKNGQGYAMKNLRLADKEVELEEIYNSLTRVN